ncbi:DMT family transporter [Acinetobacter sp. MB5]|uniref:DMT family transporter n=1 Tax=Acinetobacter sp. MB5 TaxID=2069438 RepID=UPI000DD0DDF7|nr:DMT family transporter [Acinetobacter sp. MB5]
MNLFLYALVVLIWGTTWIAITAQSNFVDPVVAVFWRFLVAASCLVFGLLITRRLRRFSVKDHLFFAVQGLCVFGLNFLCFYHAIAYINSGLESVIFSMAVLFNTLNSRLFFGQKISPQFFPAVTLGFMGMFLLFWQDLSSTHLQTETLLGIGLCMLGTYGFSLGNMISARHQKRGLDVLSTNAYAMSYGTLWMGGFAAMTGMQFLPVWNWQFIVAVGYLAIFGSVVGFTAYFILVGRIGAGQAAYSTLLFPLVALSISTIWENYHWSLSAVIGVMCILLGNLVFFLGPKLRNLAIKKAIS